MLNATVDLTQINAAFDRMPAQVVEAIRVKMRALTTNLQSHVIRDKLQGQVLHHRTGALGRSI